MAALHITMGSDHAGFAHKEELKKMLESEGCKVIDRGTFGEASVDYPDYIHPAACDVQNKRADFGVIVCGSGNGAAMTANRHSGVRAALCWEEETAKLARAHNDANIISIPARFVNVEDAKKMVRTFLSTAFEGGRHQTRIDKIEKNNC